MPLRTVLLQLAQTALRAQLHIQPQGRWEGEAVKVSDKSSEWEDLIYLKE